MTESLYAHWSATISGTDARVIFEATEEGAVLVIQLANGIVYRVEANRGELTATRGTMDQVPEPLKRQPGRPRGARDTKPRTRRWPVRPSDVDELASD